MTTGKTCMCGWERERDPNPPSESKMDAVFTVVLLLTEPQTPVMSPYWWGSDEAVMSPQGLVHLAKAGATPTNARQASTPGGVGPASPLWCLAPALGCRLGPRHLIDRSHGVLWPADPNDSKNCTFVNCVVAKLYAVWSLFQIWRRLWFVNAIQTYKNGKSCNYMNCSLITQVEESRNRNHQILNKKTVHSAAGTKWQVEKHT